VKLDGIHHITCITADAPRNVDFYTRVLGLRLVKKSVNQDDPTVYHLFYADERGDPGSDITFFEYPNAMRGRAGAGMIHRITWRLASEDALAFWTDRLEHEGIDVQRDGAHSIRFDDPEGLGLELSVVQTADTPLVAEHPEIPSELALQGFDSVRAYASDPDASRGFLEETLGFAPHEAGYEWEIRAESRGSFYGYDIPPEGRAIPGAGTVHHVAWASTNEEHAEWRRRVEADGMHPTPIIDRFWFKSIYFREPSGVLFEIATLGPGFATDEPLEHLGEELTLPPNFEHLRGQLERVLTPLPDPRAARTAS
jgi:glyoxalase family protein